VADKVDGGPKSVVDDWGIPSGFFGASKKIDAAINGAGQYARYCYLFSGTSWVQFDWKDQEKAALTKGLGDWDLPADVKAIDALAGLIAARIRIAAAAVARIHAATA
jgi:hypothetical protein